MAHVFPAQQVVHHIGTNVIEELSYHVKQNNNHNVNKVLLKRYRQKQYQQNPECKKQMILLSLPD